MTLCQLSARSEWIAAAKFHYNDKKHAATGQISFVLNYGRYSWKGNLEVQIEIPKLEEFLTKLQRSWKEAGKSMEVAQEIIKKQYDKKTKELLKVKDRR